MGTAPIQAQLEMKMHGAVLWGRQGDLFHIDFAGGPLTCQQNVHAQNDPPVLRLQLLLAPDAPRLSGLVRFLVSIHHRNNVHL
jgi:hypothetical protein